MKQFLIGIVGAVLAGVILLYIEYNVMGQDKEERTETGGTSAQEQYDYSYDDPAYYPDEDNYYDEPEYYPEKDYYYDEPEYNPDEDHYYSEPEYYPDEDYSYDDPEYQSGDLGGPEYMTITEYRVGTNGFYYEFDITEDSLSFIEYDGLVIWGDFEFSRALTPEEKDNLYHSGRLEDQYGNEIEEVSFWTHVDDSGKGVFAAELPKNLPRGSYTYTLTLDIMGGNSYSSTAPFDY